MVNTIFKYKKTSEQSEYVKQLFRSAEQRINFVYMIIMIAFGAAILIYIINNQWDDLRFFYGGIAGGFLLVGIIINIIFRKQAYPWIKYLNNVVMVITIAVLCGYSDDVAPLLLLIPFINSFYFRPVFTLVTGLVCLLMMYITIMSIMLPYYNIEGNFEFNPILAITSAFDFTDETQRMVFSGKSFLMVAGAALVIMSVYLSFSSRQFTIRQGELMQKNLTTETELKVAKDIQEGILSADFPDNDSYAVYANMTAATEVGGDFYDYFPIDETHLAVVVGDVSGHGMAAAMFMTLSKTLIQVYARMNNATDKTFELTNRYLQRSNPAKFFVTSWIGILDLTTGTLSYTNAGHNFPVLIRKGSEPEFLSDKPNFVLGRRRLVRYREKRTKLKPGDKLVLYTDGVTEAQDAAEEFFGDDRLLSTIAREKEHDQQEIVTAIRQAVNDFENGKDHYDDATILALSFKDYLRVEPPESMQFYLTTETFDSVTEYVTGKCAEAGCDDETVGKLEIATSEILANIESYAYENGGELEILTKSRDRRMTIIFKDRGNPFNPLLVQEPDVNMPLTERKPGGLGVFIVKKLVSETSYTYENGQNILTIEMDY